MGPSRHATRPPAGPAAPAGRHPAGPAGRRPAAPARRAPGCALDELVAGFARLYLEVECGRRTPAQARPLLTAKLACQLEGRWVRPSAQPAELIRVTGARVTRDVYEAVALLRRGPRVGALAVRLERRHGRWLVVDASRPEDGPLPPPPFTFPEDEADPLADLLEAAAEDPSPVPA